MSNYLTEAFRSLEVLDEEVFDTTIDGFKELRDFEDENEEETVTVVDPDAEDEEELEDSYIGKVILDCCVCHTDIYKDKDEITLDEEEGIANVGEECPYCFSNEGFKIIGEVKPFSETEVETEDEVEVDVDGEEVEEDEEEIEEAFGKKSASKPIKPSQLKKGMKISVNGKVTKVKNIETSKDENGTYYDVTTTSGNFGVYDNDDDISLALVEQVEEAFGKKNLKPVNLAQLKKGTKLSINGKVTKVVSVDKEKDENGVYYDVTTTSGNFGGYQGDDGLKNIYMIEQVVPSERNRKLKESKKFGNKKSLTEKYIKFPFVMNVTDDMTDKEIRQAAADYFDVSEFRANITDVNGDTATIEIGGSPKELFKGAVKFLGEDGALEVFGDYGEDVYFEVAPLNRKFSKFIKDLTAISNKHGVAIDVVGGIDFFIPEIGQRVRYSNDLSSGDITYTITGPKVTNESFSRKNRTLKESVSRITKKSLMEAPYYELSPRYDSRKSFYGKAHVDTGDNDDKNKLWSYDTLVAEMKDGKPVVYGTYSATTLRHIKDWLKQNGFRADNSKQIMADYGVKEEACHGRKSKKSKKMDESNYSHSDKEWLLKSSEDRLLDKLFLFLRDNYSDNELLDVLRDKLDMDAEDMMYYGFDDLFESYYKDCHGKKSKKSIKESCSINQCQ